MLPNPVRRTSQKVSYWGLGLALLALACVSSLQAQVEIGQNCGHHQRLFGSDRSGRRGNRRRNPNQRREKNNHQQPGEYVVTELKRVSTR